MRKTKGRGAFGSGGSSGDRRQEIALARHRHVVWAETTGRVLTVAIKVGGVVMVSRYVYFSITAVAGKSTDFQFVTNILASLHVNQWLAYLLGGGGLGYGYWERQFRKKRTKKLSERIIELETVIDPKRSSSGIDPKGNTERDY